MNKTVSVVIPTCGGAEYLGRCLESVLNQTYEEIEVIIVDDNGVGSSNQMRTAELIAKSYAKDNVKYVCHQKNINGAAARNTGVKNSRGEYIALLDDDDVFLPYRIERQVKLLDALPQSFAAVYCSHETFLAGKKIGEKHATLNGHILYEYMSHKVEIASSAIMIRRSVWEELNGFDETFKRHQDWEFISRVLFKYKIMSDDFYGFERHLIFRNRAASPIVAKQRREYYLEKMSPILNTLPQHQVNEIIIGERVDIALYYLKDKQILRFFCELYQIKSYRVLFLILVKRLVAFIRREQRIIK